MPEWSLFIAEKKKEKKNDEERQRFIHLLAKILELSRVIKSSINLFYSFSYYQEYANIMAMKNKACQKPNSD